MAKQGPRGGSNRSGGKRGGAPKGGQAGRGRAGAGRPGGQRGGPGRGAGSARGAGGDSRGGDRRAGGGGGPAKGLGGRQIEGRQAVREMLIGQRRKVHEIWISAELEGDPGVDDIVTIAGSQRVNVVYIAKSRLEKEARSEAPQGVLAHAAELPEADLGPMLRGEVGGAPFLVAVDGVTDPGNLGAIIRSCDGAGVTGVLLPRHRAVHVTPTVAKAAAGAIEFVPMALVPGLPTALAQMKEHGIWVVGLDDAADRSIFEIADLAVEPICLVLGAEGAGLSRLVRDRCDAIVSIPMLGGVSSLNVSAAAALSTYQVTQARAAAG
ncbi:MAG: 23S rRNA (guanosine(2251)-2'-O)-methyltransferase RlmB [Ilumatobacter sp.]